LGRIPTADVDVAADEKYNDALSQVMESKATDDLDPLNLTVDCMAADDVDDVRAVITRAGGDIIDESPAARARYRFKFRATKGNVLTIASDARVRAIGLLDLWGKTP
jgi:predicted enzyme related to lactoylglutathione lyase